ncbi:carboxypeptidase-like regulatory domain-containing protein [Abyssalbus ytuae]|uniref:Carboxypeptidase-like regulatory domain-containing protein n=1 Tax=Abyssalbus ytuae TaxID=2926907 RepID=A0A9E6ZYM1_9FLAO|nr:carboxypeptidase-like regulatory domain-containing protein [Abyssalbus ytuae]UOB17602.1 carboxypeptidase-like regulatory domain-containing protein [Abyssalbus ytuae]
MKTSGYYQKQNFFFVVFIILFGLGNNQSVFAFFQEQEQAYVQYKGDVVDSESNDPVISAILSISDTNISTVTNTEGEFLLKVPVDKINGVVTVSSLGYITTRVPLTDFSKDEYRIKLKPSVIELPQVNIEMPGNAELLVRETLKKKGVNNINDHLLMTAFYRETIKKRRRNVSLAEAVVNVYKKPYSSQQKDEIELFKSRKSTDYKRLDTVALKLQGGPFNTLYGDVMKYPEYIFTEETIDEYSFSFDQSTVINNKPVYVVNFKPLPGIEDLRFSGKLFIDSNTLAMVSASYRLNVENKEKASTLFVRKKPKNFIVYPTEAEYKVDYREKNGKWYYGYSNIHLTFKINHKKRIFNSVYSLDSEMAVTNWEKINDNNPLKPKDRLKPSIVLSDEASGFSDPEFWGAHNVIEPEKSIESAINKIKRQLERGGSS